MFTSSFSPRTVYGNLQFRKDGTVTAAFVTPTANVKYSPRKRRLGPLFSWAALNAALGGRFVHHSGIRQVPVSAVMERMAAAVPGGAQNLGDYPAWEGKMAETREFVNGLSRPGVEKFNLLVADLDIEPAPAHQVALWSLSETLSGTKPPPPSEKKLREARAAADALLRRLVAFVPGIVPATEGQLRWAYGFCASFGGVETPYTHPHFASHHEGPVEMVPLLNAVLNAKRGWRDGHVTIQAPLVRDPLSGVVDKEGTQEVFQAFLVVRDEPGMWSYPDDVLVDVLDKLPFPYRLSIFGRSVSNREARAKLNSLFKSVAWTLSESISDSTPDLESERSAKALQQELHDLLSGGGPATPASVVICIAASDKVELEERVNALKDALDSTRTYLDRPLGLQSSLWAAMLPGSVAPLAVKLYERQFHPLGLASLGVFHDEKLGDEEGRLWALVAGRSEDSLNRFVYRNAIKGPDEAGGNRGSTTGNGGDQGCGKTMEVKEIAHDTLCLNGGVYVFDRTDDGEWAKASMAWHVPVTVIRFSSSRITIDPLRVFTANLPEDKGERATLEEKEERANALLLAEKHTLGYLAISLSIRAGDDDRYVILRRAVQQLLKPDFPLAPSMPNLLSLLSHWGGVGGFAMPLREDGEADSRFEKLQGLQASEAERLVLRLSAERESGATGRNIFGDGEPLDLTTPAVIFAAPGLKFDSEASRALVYLASAYALAFLSASDRFNLICLSELAALAEDEFGYQLVDDILRMSRRKYGGLNADSQLARDFVKSELIITRTVGRTSDASAATEALKFVGMSEPTDDDVIDLTSLPTGFKFYRDLSQRIGVVQVIPPLNAERFELARTDRRAPVKVS